jgi:hypothetical protein
MTRTFVLLNFIFSICQAAHFFGGSMSWRFKSFNGTNSSLVTIQFKQTYSWLYANQPCQVNTGTNANLTCLVGCSTSSTDILIDGFCIGSDQGLNVTRSENVAELNFPLGSSIVLAYQSNAWASLVSYSGGGGWSLISYLNLIVRNDTGRINSSPFSSMPPIVTVPTKLKQTIRIPLFDSDGDFVRCRWAIKNMSIESTIVDECSAVCRNLPESQLISSQNNCSLSILLNTTGYFVVALQLEDFSSSNPNGSVLSSVPLQFLIRTVDTLGCAAIPKIVGTFTDGTTIQIAANSIFSTSIIARVFCSYSPIDRFMTVTSPSGLFSLTHVVKLNVTHYYSKFTWLASIDAVGTIQMFCTSAIDIQEFSSAQFCLNFQIIAPTTTSTSTSTSTSTTTMTTISSSIQSEFPLALVLGLGIPLFLLLSLLAACSLCPKWCAKSFRFDSFFFLLVFIFIVVVVVLLFQWSCSTTILGRCQSNVVSKM